jgi:hypothetical protein
MISLQKGAELTLNNNLLITHSILINLNSCRLFPFITESKIWQNITVKLELKSKKCHQHLY